MNQEHGNFADAANHTSLDNTAALNLINKLRQAGTPLGETTKGRLYRGIKTGLNKTFLIDNATRDRLLTEDARSEELIKPWLRGRDLRRWQAQAVTQYLITVPSSANHPWPWANANDETEALQLFKDTYPAIYTHFIAAEDRLRQRHDHGKFFWELRSCIYYAEFAKPKIMFPETSKWMRACYDTSGAVCANTIYALPTEDLYLLAILQSRIFDWYARHEFQTLGDPWSFSGRIRFQATSIEKFPLWPATATQQTSVIDRVQAILADHTLNQLYWQDEVDEILFDVYQLTDQEKALIREAEKLHSFTAKSAGVLADVPEEEEEVS